MDFWTNKMNHLNVRAIGANAEIFSTTVLLPVPFGAFDPGGSDFGMGSHWRDCAQMRASACLKQMVVYERTILLPFRLVRYATQGTISETGLPERANPSQSGLIKSGLIENLNTQLTLNGW